MTPMKEMAMKIRPDDLNMSVRTLVLVVIWAWILYCIMSIYSTPAYPSERGRHDDIVVESDVTVEGDRVKSSSESSSESDSNSSALSNSNSVSEGGDSSTSVSTKSENNSIVLTGARDSAACFTKMGVGAEGFGIFWSRSDPYCKKVRLIARHIDTGNFQAAARLECTLKEWEEVYGHKTIRDPGYQTCIDDLTVSPPPSPEPVAKYEDHIKAQDDNSREIQVMRMEQAQLREELAEARMLLERQEVQAQSESSEPFITPEKREAVLRALKGVEQ